MYYVTEPSSVEYRHLLVAIAVLHDLPLTSPTLGRISSEATIAISSAQRLRQVGG